MRWIGKLITWLWCHTSPRAHRELLYEGRVPKTNLLKKGNNSCKASKLESLQK